MSQLELKVCLEFIRRTWISRTPTGDDNQFRRWFFRGTKATLLLATSVVYTGTEALATEWSVSLWGKPRATTEHVEKLADLVQEKTGGEFVLNIVYGGLSKPRDNLEGISIGAFEMAQFCVGHNPDKTPSLSVLELPFMSVEGLAENRLVSEAVHDFQMVRQELEEFNAFLLMPTPMPQYNLVGFGEVPNAVDDFAGLNVSASGRIGEALRTAGANSKNMQFSETETAFRSGNLAAVAHAPHSHMAMGSADTGSWWTANLNLGTPQCPIAVNIDALGSLSDEHREALLGSVDQALDHYVDNYLENVMRPWLETVSENGITTVIFDSDSLDNFAARIEAPIGKAWIEKNSDRLLSEELFDFAKGKSKPRCCRDDEMCKKCPK